MIAEKYQKLTLAQITRALNACQQIIDNPQADPRDVIIAVDHVGELQEAKEFLTLMNPPAPPAP